jgi:hypothetical protein
MRKTVVPSDSGYLTTEGSEKTIGDVSKAMYLCLILSFSFLQDDSVLSMPNEHSLRSEPPLMLTLADEFSKVLICLVFNSSFAFLLCCVLGIS